MNSASHQREGFLRETLRWNGFPQTRIQLQLMINFGKYLSIVSFGIAVTAVSLPAQDYNSLPDDPGQALLARTTTPLPDDPGQAFLAKAANPDPFPSDPGQTQKPTIDI